MDTFRQKHPEYNIYNSGIRSFLKSNMEYSLKKNRPFCASYAPDDRALCGSAKAYGHGLYKRSATGKQGKCLYTLAKREETDTSVSSLCCAVPVDLLLMLVQELFRGTGCFVLLENIPRAGVIENVPPQHVDLRQPLLRRVHLLQKLPAMRGCVVRFLRQHIVAPAADRLQIQKRF